MIENFLLLTGEDDFRLRERIRFLKNKFREKYPDGEIQSFDSESEWMHFETSVITPNLFGGKRLIFTESFWNSEHFEQASKRQFFDRLPEFIDSCTVVSVEPKLDKRLKSTKFFIGDSKNTSVGKVENFDLLSENETLQWIQIYAKKKGGTIDTRCSQVLLRRCGVNLWYLSSEIDKLVLVDEGVITESLIEEMTLPHPEALIWGFLEQVSKGNLEQSLKSFHTLLASRTSPHEIFPMLTREVRIHAQIRSGLDQGLNSKDIATQTSLHPFVVQKTAPLTRRFSLQKIQQLYDHLFIIDRKVKTGQILSASNDTSEFELAIEKFILDMCRK